MITKTSNGAMSPAQFCREYSIGLTKFYAELAAGRLVARKLGRRTMILAEDARHWANSLPRVEVKDPTIA
jgi:hypothetical protein